jgi:integrase
MAKRGQNEGSITKRSDGRWQARVTLPDGRRKSYYAKTRQEVQKKMQQALRDIDSGLPIVSERQTVEQFLLLWLVDIKHQLKVSSFHRYDSQVRLHIIPALGHHLLTKLKPQQVQTFYSQKMESGLSSTTVRHLLSTPT